MNLVEIRVINSSVPPWMKELKPFCRRVLKELGKDKWDVSVVLCDDAFISELNGKFRGKHEPTDVLSFAQSSGIGPADYHVAGDIVISIETMKRSACEQQVPEKIEAKRLLTHGLLHLSGMDHEDNAVEGEMLDLQERILRDFSGV